MEYFVNQLTKIIQVQDFRFKEFSSFHNRKFLRKYYGNFRIRMPNVIKYNIVKIG